MDQNKTWARELALAMWLFAGYLAYSGMTNELELWIWPTTVITLPAFGFRQPVVGDWMRGRSSQSLNGRGSQRSGQRAGREDQHPDFGDYEDNGAEAGTTAGPRNHPEFRHTKD